MARVLNATEVKHRILALLDEVAAGETIEITKHGRPVARLVPANGPHALKGKLRGEAATGVVEEEAFFSTGVGWEHG